MQARNKADFDRSVWFTPQIVLGDYLHLDRPPKENHEAGNTIKKLLPESTGPSRFSSPEDLRVLLTLMAFRTPSPLTQSPWPLVHILVPQETCTLSRLPKPSTPQPQNPWLLTLRFLRNHASRHNQKALAQMATGLWPICCFLKKFMTPGLCLTLFFGHQRI